jgi:hypothetical protein
LPCTYLISKAGKEIFKVGLLDEAGYLALDQIEPRAYLQQSASAPKLRNAHCEVKVD